MFTNTQYYHHFFSESLENSFIFDSIIYKINGQSILKGVSLRLEKGKICGLFGENGSGKSTLIKIGAGQLKALEGLILLEEKAFSTPARIKRFSKIAYLSQETFLPDNYKVYQIIKSFPEKAQAILAKDNILSKLKDSRPATLSGGERRYLELCLILSLEREFVLIDEPFSGIEPLIIEKIQQLLILYAKQKKGILITDHYYRYVSQIADYAYLITDGRCQFFINNNDLEYQLRNRFYTR